MYLQLCQNLVAKCSCWWWFYHSFILMLQIVVRNVVMDPAGNPLYALLEPSWTKFSIYQAGMPCPSRLLARHPPLHPAEWGSINSLSCKYTFSKRKNSSPVWQRFHHSGHKGGILCNESNLLNGPLVLWKSEFILHRSQVYIQRAVSSLPEQTQV